MKSDHHYFTSQYLCMILCVYTPVHTSSHSCICFLSLWGKWESLGSRGISMNELPQSPLPSITVLFLNDLGDEATAPFYEGSVYAIQSGLI